MLELNALLLELKLQHFLVENDTIGCLRYKKILVLNLDADKTILDERLNRRVDKMLQRGLLNELDEFYSLV